MQRTSVALLFALSACSGNTSTPTSSSASPQGFTLVGAWSLQAVASASCSSLSADARNRTYPTVTIYQTGYDTISINVSANSVSSVIMTPSYYGLKIQDRLRLVDNVVVGGLVIDGMFTSSSVTSTRIAGTLNGNFTTATADCAATDHSLTFTR